MDSGIASLHKILKDKIRRRIILLLHEQGSLSYMDLIKEIGITNTGRMNYHLKVLGDLLKKTEDSKYALTEKGSLAVKLLLEFPEKSSDAQTEIWLPRWLFVAGCIFSVIFIIGFFALYVRGIIDFARMVLYSFIGVSVFALLIVSNKVRKMRVRWSINRQMLGHEILFIMFGALAGAAFFIIVGTLLLFAFETLLQSAGIRFNLFPFAWWLIISFVLGPIIGGLGGYLIYKKRALQNRIL